MPDGFKELDAVVTLADQMKSDEGPNVLINVFTVDPADEDALLKAWAHDADFMKTQPGYISTQLHKGLAGSSTLVNYAVWQNVESFRNAFTSPEFQRRIRLTRRAQLHRLIYSRSFLSQITASRELNRAGFAGG